MKPTVVSVVGLGRLGLPLAAVMAKSGLGVIGVDVDQARVDIVNEGHAPFFEPGLDDLLPILATTNITQAVLSTDVTFVIVATPSRSDGSFSLEYVLTACRQIGEALRMKDDYHVVVIASTVMPGACAGSILMELEKASGKDSGPSKDGRVGDFGIVHVPEFVALGSVVDDFRHPDFVLIGADDPKPRKIVNALYRKIVGQYPPILLMNLVNAEMAKIALNCYLTTKISFANQMAGICELIPGANVNTVTTALGLDSRIEPAYLKGAAPFAGPCFPRDVRAMSALAQGVGACYRVTHGVGAFNEEYMARLVDLALDELNEVRPLGRIGVLGLAFKPGTDCTTDSPGMKLLYRMDGDYGAMGYDPLVWIEGRSCGEAQDVADESEVVVVTTADVRWRAVRWRKGQTVIDLWRVLDGGKVREAGAKYVAVGVGV